MSISFDSNLFKSVRDLQAKMLNLLYTFDMQCYVLAKTTWLAITRSYTHTHTHTYSHWQTTGWRAINLTNCLLSTNSHTKQANNKYLYIYYIPSTKHIFTHLFTHTRTHTHCCTHVRLPHVAHIFARSSNCRQQLAHVCPALYARRTK